MSLIRGKRGLLVDMQFRRLANGHMLSSMLNFHQKAELVFL